MGIFTRDEEEVRVYDGDAFWYFVGTILLVVLLPWTFFLARHLATPRPPPEADWEASGRAPKHARVKRCVTSGMEARRVASIKAAASWRRRLWSSGAGLQLVVLAVLWIIFFAVLHRIANTPEKLSGFDPFAILDVPSDATMAAIKKAYRQKSLAHHPDKDRDNPMAPALFQQISKAYAALTEEGPRQNWEKYGNPDGPVQMKVGIAIHPAILGSRERQLTTLCVFFAILLLGPLLVVLCCLRGGNRPSGSVSNETLRCFQAIMDNEMTREDGPSVLATAQEVQANAVSVSMTTAEFQHLLAAMAAVRPTPLGPNVLVEIRGAGEFKGRRGLLREPVSPTSLHVLVFPPDRPPTSLDDGTLTECQLSDLRPLQPKFHCLFSDKAVQRITALIWAHMWRLHAQIPYFMRAELGRILRRSECLGRAMVSLSSCGKGDRSGCLEAARGMAHFRQHLVQALDFGAPPLLQLPHVSEFPAGKAFEALPSFAQVVHDRDGALGKVCRLLNLSDNQKLDVQAFCRHMPKVELSCRVEVDDEADIAKGDLATMVVTLTRTNLEEGEAVGPIHAPLWPCPKFEEWWVLVHDPISRRFVTADAILGTGRTETCKLRFMVPRSGDFSWKVEAICDSYVGLDVTAECSWKVAKRSEVDRSIFIHPNDMNIRTLFEELMQGLQPREEEDSESEEDLPPPKPKPKPKVVDDDSSDDSSDGEHPNSARVAQAAAKREAAAVVAAAKAKAKAEAKAKAMAKKAVDSDSDSDFDEPDGIFVKIIGSDPEPIWNGPDRGYQEPQQVGAMPTGTVVRGHKENRPQGWFELALSSGNIWLKLDSSGVEELGPMLEQPLRIVITTATPIWMIKRWVCLTTQPLIVDDILAIRDMDNDRFRVVIEELVRQHLGEAKYEDLVQQALARIQQRRDRLGKTQGYFMTQNGCVWHVNAAGKVLGLHPDGSKIQDKIEISAEALTIGSVFTLDEAKAKTSAFRHWLRKDKSDSAWIWSPDLSLETRVRIGTAW